MVVLLYVLCVEVPCPLLQVIINLMKNSELLIMALETSLITLLTSLFLYTTIGVLGRGALRVFLYRNINLESTLIK